MSATCFSNAFSDLITVTITVTTITVNYGDMNYGDELRSNYGDSLLNPGITVT